MDLSQSKKTVLVTGGAGYVGSHACKGLAEAGYVPVVYDNLSKANRNSVLWGPLEEGNIVDRKRLDEVLKKHAPYAVMHFAAFIEAGESVQDPAKYYENNTAGALSLLQSMRANGVERFLFSSTAAVYGEPLQIPIEENHSLFPINPYGASKLMVERILADFSQAYGLHYTALRYFNAAGSDPQGMCGEDHNPETHLIPLVLQVALGQRPYINVYGDDYDTPDGSCIRDYVHVTDLVDAHLLALEALKNKNFTPAYNLGNGQGFSVFEVIEMAKQITGKEIPVQIGIRRPGDPAKLVANSNKAYEELGWKPNHSALEQIIETAWRWAKNKQT